MNQRLRSLLKAAGCIPAGWWVVVLTLPALVPLMGTGFFESDDGLLHVYRLAALDRAMRTGILYPRWFPEFAFGYGQPVLNFYGPLSYYWGLPFTLLGADAVVGMKLVLATGLIASALSMYLFTRLYLARGPALVAAIVYVYLPYHLLDLYVRGAVAEFLAFMWFPLVLWAFHRLIKDPARHQLPLLGLASLLLAALVVTHSLSAFIFVPVLAVYAGIMLVRARHSMPQARSATGRVVLAFVLASAVSAFYWLPVLIEAQYVGLGHGASSGYREHLLPWTNLFSLSSAYPYPGEPDTPRIFPMGLVQAAIIAAALVLIFRPLKRRWVTILFLALALLSAFMLTTASLPVWRAFEWGLAFLQYPWRFQALTALATAFLAGTLVEGLTPPSSWRRAALCVLLLLVTGIWALWRLPITPMTPELSVEAMWQMDQDHGQVGTTWTGEYLPIWVKEQRWAISHPTSGSILSDVRLPEGQVKLTGVGYTHYDLTLNAPQGTDLTLHQFHYPGWEAVGKGPYIPQESNISSKSRPRGELGLASFHLQPGEGSLRLRLGHPPAQRWGTLISVVACLAMGVALVAQSLRAGVRSTLGPLFLAACYLLLAVVLFISLVLPSGYTRATSPVNANLEDTVELLAFATDKAIYQPGDALDVTLYWRSLSDLDQNHKTFVHLTDEALTQQPAQHDGDPNGGFTPTSRWLPGELVPDIHHLILPANLPPGRYLLWAGMYEYETVRNLSVLSAEVLAAEDRLLLGEIEVASP